jgi:glycosyltransferase involved in cell wall biosynthesis
LSSSPALDLRFAARVRELTMRIALLSYRSKTHCGGQGVYVRHLSRGLVELGHDVEVFSGQPYPEGLDPRVRLTKVPSLDLYREPDPFRVPRPSEIRDRIDVLELLTTWTAGFPEPRTFTMRAARLLAERLGDFDVVHDNQSLGPGLLDIAGSGLPVVATVHHPITRDRILDVAAAPWWRKPLVRRWYGFAEMQKKVARQIPELLTVSSTSASDIAKDFDVAPSQLHVVPLGVDTALFKPADRRVRNRIIAIASADVPLKGVSHLLHAVARLRVERDLELQLVAKLEPNGPTEKLIAELGISDIVHISSGLTDTELADLLASAEISCIPSLYEGFSLPAVEAMASGTPIVASRAGALPEVVGADGECARLVRPADVDELTKVLGELLDSPQELARLGAAGRRRALEVFSWQSVAAQTVAVYEKAMTKC